MRLRAAFAALLCAVALAAQAQPATTPGEAASAPVKPATPAPAPAQLATPTPAPAATPPDAGNAATPPTSGATRFPALTGRVVDQAGLLDADTRTRLTQQLAAHEQATGQQIVVVTLADLGGQSIEDYGYQLGRQWGVGQRGKDNGALLIVARAERRVRIEVGYGLEGQLTDAISSAIINRVIVPAFRANDYARGISDGVGAMLDVLRGGEDGTPRGVTGATPAADEGIDFHKAVQLLIVIAFVVLMIASRLGGGGGRRRRGSAGDVALGAILGSMGRRGGGGFGGGGFGGGGGGFRGGGGGFGGGGASGGW